MNERVQRALDGEGLREGLSAAEVAERDAAEAAIAAALDGVRSMEAPDLAPEIMRRIEALDASVQGASPWRRLLEALWVPRPIAVRPVWALAVALAVVAGVVWLAPSLRVVAAGATDASAAATAGNAGPAGVTASTAADVQSGSGAAVGTPTASAVLRVYVRFRLDAPGATSVALAGDFTGWKPAVALQQVAAGVWSVEVPLPPGIHTYSFVVDGRRWLADPEAPRVKDGFGGWNSQVAVLPPQVRAAS